jgi:hypothetical protein
LIAYLMADEAERTASLHVRIDETNGFVKRFWVQDWIDPRQSFEWAVSVQKAALYEVTLMISAPRRTQVEVEGPQNKLKLACQAAFPQFFGFNWNRITLKTPLTLPAGKGTIRARLLQPIQTEHGAALKSIELLDVAERPAMDARIRCSARTPAGSTSRSSASCANAANGHTLSMDRTSRGLKW